MAIKIIDYEQCNGCGICVENCMMDVFRMDEKTKKPVITYPEDCAVCYVCETDCPASAITVTPEVVAEIALIAK